ncbi:MAG: hypothetical protein ABIP65_06715 [Vicinamibacterales bacterium]
MTAVCEQIEAGAVELYFYDDMSAAARVGMAAHVAQCRDCAIALEELKVIRAALASRSDLASPPAGDWSAFMHRLDAAIRPSPPRMAPSVVAFLAPGPRPPLSAVRPYIGLIATAALLAIVTMSVFYVARNRSMPGTRFVQRPPVVETRPTPESTPVATAGMQSVGEQHFERSKLVVLGLASKESSGVDVADWAYERSLASLLLNDTRLYRLAAEERGLTSLAGVMRDLELVLLETSMSEGSDPAELPQIQRLIRKRQLIQKMDVVNTVGLTP